MLKKAIQAILQRVLGFDRYLFLFSRWKISTLKWDSQKKEGDFNYFLTLLEPDHHVLDIGANIGIMSVLMAKECPNGRVYAFEPIPQNFQALQKIIQHYRLSNVSLYQAALGETNNPIEMTMPIVKGVRMQGLSHVDHPSIEGYEGQMLRFDVQQLVLDELPEFNHQPIHAIKMDVENYEQFVLRGGKALLGKHRPLIYCELWENENRKNCMDLLKALGYLVFVLEKGQLQPFEADKHSHHNFFFLPGKVGNHPN